MFPKSAVVWPMDIHEAHQRKVFKLRLITSCAEVIAVDVDDRETTDLPERHYTRLLPEGLSSLPPATASTPLGAFCADDETSFFRHLDVIRQQMTAILDKIEKINPAGSQDSEVLAGVAALYNTLTEARTGNHSWQDLHSDDRLLLERAERVLQKAGLRSRP